MWQNSFNNEMATLYVVATPIGNLQEMTPRAIEILRTVDIIAAEDTRHSLRLCQHFNIHTELISHHAHNQQESISKILTLLESGKNIALVSDAGMPLISDPGNLLVKHVALAGFNVVAISGATALINALVVSGLASQPFLFHGFLPATKKQIRKVCQDYKYFPFTLIFFVSVHKLSMSIEALYELFGERQVCLCRELTKIHESIYRGKLSHLLRQLDNLKGEFVLVVEGCANEKEADLDEANILAALDELIESGYSAKSAIAKVAKDYTLNKNEVYQMYLQGQKL